MMNGSNHSTDRLRKAAILIASIDTKSADAILDQMPAEQAAQVRLASMELREIPAQEQEEIIQEFLQGNAIRSPRATKSQGLTQQPRFEMQPEEGQHEGIELEGSLAHRFAATENGETNPMASEAVYKNRTFAANAYATSDMSLGTPPLDYQNRITTSPEPTKETEKTDTSTRSPSSDATQTDATLSTSNFPSPFQFLEQADEETLAPLLSQESPQTIAVVLAHLPSQQAATVLSGLPQELQLAVVRRIVDLDETDPEVVREIAQTLDSLLSGHSHLSRRRSAGLSTMNDILAAANPAARMDILGHLAKEESTLAQQLGFQTARSRSVNPTLPSSRRPRVMDSEVPEPRPLSFRDLEQWDDASLREVLRLVDPDVILLALIDDDGRLASRIFGLFPAQQAEAMKHRFQHLGPIRLSDIEKAQDRLVQIALDVRNQEESQANLSQHAVLV